MKSATLRHIFPLLLAYFGALGSALQLLPNAPAGDRIVADQLSTDYLQDLLPLMGQGGFNRLSSRGW